MMICLPPQTGYSLPSHSSRYGPQHTQHTASTSTAATPHYPRYVPRGLTPKTQLLALSHAFRSSPRSAGVGGSSGLGGVAGGDERLLVESRRGVYATAQGEEARMTCCCLLRGGGGESRPLISVCASARGRRPCQPHGPQQDIVSRRRRGFIIIAQYNIFCSPTTDYPTPFIVQYIAYADAAVARVSSVGT